MRLTTLWVCVCPTRISMFEQTIDRQKFSRIMDRSDRIYLKENIQVINATIPKHCFTIYLHIHLVLLHQICYKHTSTIICLKHMSLEISIYLHKMAYITASVIKARQDKPQPTISVTDGTPEYSIVCGENTDKQRQTSWWEAVGVVHAGQ